MLVSSPNLDQPFSTWCISETKDSWNITGVGQTNDVTENTFVGAPLSRAAHHAIKCVETGQYLFSLLFFFSESVCFSRIFRVVFVLMQIGPVTRVFSFGPVSAASLFEMTTFPSQCWWIQYNTTALWSKCQQFEHIMMDSARVPKITF